MILRNSTVMRTDINVSGGGVMNCALTVNNDINSSFALFTGTNLESVRLTAFCFPSFLFRVRLDCYSFRFIDSGRGSDNYVVTHAVGGVGVVFDACAPDV